MNKKGNWNFLDLWVEYVAFLLLVLGFFVGLAAGSKVLTYIVLFLVGVLIGRMILKRKYIVIIYH